MERLVAALSEAAARADLVVCTGGLGPTSDDLTHEALGLATGREMVEYSPARRHVEEAFERFTGRRPPPSAYKQVLFPDGSELVANPSGTAMGALLELEGTLFATLPGVPSEMKRMFEETLEPLIGKRSEGVIVSRLLRFAGISEEEMSEKVRDFLDSSDPTVAPLAGPGEVGKGEVQLRVTARAPTRTEAEDKIGPVVEEILSRLRGYRLQEQGTCYDQEVHAEQVLGSGESLQPIAPNALGGMEPVAGVKWEEGRTREEDEGTMTDQARCPRCRHANPPENRFCGSCGAALGAGSDLMARREGNLTAMGRTLPAKLKPAGNAVVVGLVALALRAGLSWLRHRTAAGEQPSASTAREPDTAVSKRLLGRSLEEVFIEELKADHRSRVFAWRALRSTVITEPIDRRSRS
jgi:molybdopterin-biosynthesis enzyme MoeA-like protein